MIEFDRRQFEEYARAVFTTDSPSGCTADAIALIKSYVEELGYPTRFSSTASSMLSLRWSNPVAERCGVP